MKMSPDIDRRTAEIVKLTEEDRIEAAALLLDEEVIRKLVALIFDSRGDVPPS